MRPERKRVYEKFGGRCAYCGTELKKGWHIDHIRPINRDFKYVRGKGFKATGTCRNPENENPENLNPSCASCNIMKGSDSLEQFRRKIGHFVVSLNRDSTQYKFAKRYGLIEETLKRVKFYYETL